MPTAEVLEIPKASHVRDEKFIESVKSIASDYGHKLTKTDLKTDEKDKRTVVLTFERSVSGQEELDLTAEREVDDVPADEKDQVEDE